MREKKITSLSAASGAVLIDKAAGHTSFDVLRRFRRTFGISKIGHAGTLDPPATGLLIVLLGEATRLQSVLMGGKKQYTGTILLGQETDTDDTSGRIVFSDPERVFHCLDIDKIRHTINENFLGKIPQVPPKVSAVKVDGKRSYARHRQGEHVELKSRIVEIFRFDVEGVSENHISYCIECSAGTYIRSLARDLGRALGSYGTVASLRRTASGGFSVESALAEEILAETAAEAVPIISLEDLVRGLPHIVVEDPHIESLYRGQQQVLECYRQRVAGEGEQLIAIFNARRVFVGLVTAGSSGGNRLEIRYLRPQQQVHAKIS